MGNCKTDNTWKKRGTWLGCAILTLGVLLVGSSLTLNVIQYHEKQAALKAFFRTKTPETEETGNAAGSVSSQAAADLFSEEESIPEKEKTEETSGEVFAILKIPSINSEEPVVNGTSGSNLRAALGHEPGTAMPGEAGNCVIAGHRNYTFGKYFNRLNEVQVGDSIEITTVNDTYQYEVTEIKVVEPDDVEILDATEEEQLTLYTCTPIYIATHRLVVIAKRIS